MACFKVMAIAVNHRVKNANAVQNVFTKYGCIISVRLGLHETGDVCADSGLIILQLSGTDDEVQAFSKELNEIDGVTAKTIELCP